MVFLNQWKEIVQSALCETSAEHVAIAVYRTSTHNYHLRRARFGDIKDILLFIFNPYNLDRVAKILYKIHETVGSGSSR